MRVLVTGAYGLIGSAVLARLHRDGHELVGAGRAIAAARRRFSYAKWVEADFHRLNRPDDWRPLLAGIDAVANCVGAFQRGARDDLQRIHVAGPLALFAACAESEPRRVIHVSALGVGAAGPTEFATSKGVADADALFTATAVIVQPVTGVALAYLIGYSLLDSWIVLSIALYVLVGACWLPVVWIQAQLRRLAAAAAEHGAPPSEQYHRLFRAWFVLGWPAFTGVIAIFALRIWKPLLW